MSLNGFERQERVKVARVRTNAMAHDRDGQEGVIEDFDDYGSQPYYVRFDDGNGRWVATIEHLTPPAPPIPDTPEVRALKELVFEKSMIAKRRHGWCGEIDLLLRQVGCAPIRAGWVEPEPEGTVVGFNSVTDATMYRRIHMYGNADERRWQATGSRDLYTWDQIKVNNLGATPKVLWSPEKETVEIVTETVWA